jgi:hypothetical protein
MAGAVDAASAAPGCSTARPAAGGSAAGPWRSARQLGPPERDQGRTATLTARARSDVGA